MNRYLLAFIAFNLIALTLLTVYPLFVVMAYLIITQVFFLCAEIYWLIRLSDEVKQRLPDVYRKHKPTSLFWGSKIKIVALDLFKNDQTTATMADNKIHEFFIVRDVIKYWLVSFVIGVLMVVYIAGCGHKCTCPINEDRTFNNDSIINALKEDEKIKRLWRRYDQALIEDNKQESYRLLISNSYGKSVTVMVSEDSVSTTIYSRKSVPSKVNVSDSIVITFKRAISVQQWSVLKEKLAANCFWTMEVERQPKAILDGQSWTLEGYNPLQNYCTPHSYHLVTRISPDSSNFKILCRFILELGSMSKAFD